MASLPAGSRLNPIRDPAVFISRAHVLDDVRSPRNNRDVAAFIWPRGIKTVNRRDTVGFRRRVERQGKTEHRTGLRHLAANLGNELAVGDDPSGTATILPCVALHAKIKIAERVTFCPRLRVRDAMRRFDLHALPVALGIPAFAIHGRLFLASNSTCCASTSIATGMAAYPARSRRIAPERSVSSAIFATMFCGTCPALFLLRALLRAVALRSPLHIRIGRVARKFATANRAVFDQHGALSMAGNIKMGTATQWL